VSTDLERLGRRLVGAWTTEATHPEVPGTTVSGSAEVQWLEGERFLIFRAHKDYPDPRLDPRGRRDARGSRGRAKLSKDNETWQDDLQITYRRSQ
jgi:hypothetical protein